MPTRLIIALVVLCATVLPVASANAASKAVWATVNVCDTKDAPDTIGLRGAMPGVKTKGATMWMRFQVQYRSGTAYVPVKGLDTGYLKLGAAKVRSREAGHSFRVKAPAKGSAYLMRGVLQFQWRSKAGKLLISKQRFTEAGHKSTAGADPAGYSAATCTIKG